MRILLRAPTQITHTRMLSFAPNALPDIT
jgi:hypothetical protein